MPWRFLYQGHIRRILFDRLASWKHDGWGDQIDLMNPAVFSDRRRQLRMGIHQAGVHHHEESACRTLPGYRPGKNGIRGIKNVCGELDRVVEADLK